VRYSPSHQRLTTYPLDAIEGLRAGTLAHVENVSVPQEGGLAVLSPSGGSVAPAVALQQDIEVLLVFPKAGFALPSASNSPSPALSVRFREGYHTYAEVRVSYLDAAGGVQNNTDSPGGDYLDFPSPSPSDEGVNVANCSAACEADPRCLGWTYVRPAFPAPAPPFNYAPRCSLKASPVPFAPGAMCCVSGRVTAPVVALHRSQSGTTGSTATVTAKLALVPSSANATVVELPIRIVVDHSVVEIFANHGLEAITGRLYIPLPANASSGVSVWAANMGDNSTVTARRVSAWSMMSIWL
jgi:hypothetical protein